MTKYIFYLVGRPGDSYEYNSNEWEKEDMNQDILYDKYPGYSYCIREKWVDGIQHYSNIFRLAVRRNNPYYINKFKNEM